MSDSKTSPQTTAGAGGGAGSGSVKHGTPPRRGADRANGNDLVESSSPPREREGEHLLRTSPKADRVNGGTSNERVGGSAYDAATHGLMCTMKGHKNKVGYSAAMAAPFTPRSPASLELLDTAR